MFGRPAVSRERVIGISFVDVLMQAVFVLFIALLVGYIDPDELDKIKEYQQAGKDFCQKLEKDSLVECRQFIADNPIGVQPAPPENAKYGNAGAHACELLDKKDPKACQEELSKALGSLRPCIRAASLVRPPASTEWDIRSPTEIRFIGFTADYRSYLQAQGDENRLISIKRIEPGRIFSPTEVENAIGFIKERECFHEINVTWSCECTAQQLLSPRGAIARLKALAQ